MRKSWSLWLAVALAGPAPGDRAEFTLGGEDGNPWTVLLAQEGGSYVIYGADGQLLQTIPISTSPQWVGADTLLDYSDGAMTPSWIDANANLTHIVSWDQNGQSQIALHDMGGNIRVTQGESSGFMGMTLPSTLLAYDGDRTTSMFRIFVQRVGAPPGVGRGFRNNTITNFGAEMPINRIRFYPRLSRTEDAHIIAAMAEPKPDPDSFGEESFAANFLEWYEIGVADNNAPIADDVFAIPKGLRWHKVLASAGIDPSYGVSLSMLPTLVGGYRVSNDEAYTILRSVRENLDVVVDFRFPLRHVRWVAIRALDPVRDWEIAQMEIYGQGFVRKAVYLTDILDFGQPISWGKIRWSGQRPPETQVKIRTRTGSDHNPNIYWRPNSITGEAEEISFEEHFKLPVRDREPPRYDRDHWSFWSPPYDFEDGLRVSSQDAGPWTDGIPLQSPSPRRFMQLQITLFATETQAPRLDQLQFQLAQSLSASELLGEISPIEVSDTRPQRFTYVVRPDFQTGDTGFDRLEILTHTRVDTVYQVKIGGEEVDLAAFPPQILSDRLIVALDRKLSSPETDRFKQVEVSFEVPVLRFGAEFSGWVYNSDDVDRVRQQVEPGNATFRHAGDVLAVRTRVGGRLLVDARAHPNPFTPNGDGINETMQLSFNVREVITRRPLQVALYDLSGRLVRTLAAEQVKTGTVERTWDGRGADGGLVAPGVYLYRIQLETDEGTEKLVGTVVVAY